MSIRVPIGVAENLRWWFDQDAKGEMGFRSGQGRQEDMLVSGTVGVSVSRRGYSLDPKAFRAAERLRTISESLSPLSEYTQTILSLAFRTRAKKADLSKYGARPYVALASRTARDTYVKDQPGQSLQFLEAWLSSVAAQAETAKRAEDRIRWSDLIDTIKDEAEQLLADALVAYGVQVTRTKTPTLLSLRYLQEKLHLGRKAVSQALAQHNIRVQTKEGSPAGVSLAQLREHHPEFYARVTS